MQKQKNKPYGRWTLDAQSAIKRENALTEIVRCLRHVSSPDDVSCEHRVHAVMPIVHEF